MWCDISRQIGATMKDLIILSVIIIALVRALDALAIAAKKYKKQEQIMKYKIGQEIEITEDFTLKTVGGRELTVKAGDKAIIDSKARVKYISGQARDVVQMLGKDIEVNGYDHVNIAKMIANRLNQVFGLEEFLDDNDIAAESFEIEIEDVLIDIL